MSRQRWQDSSAWSYSERECWTPLVSPELWGRVNARITNTRGSSTRRPRSEPGRYVFAGAIRCGHCGKAMFGATGKNKPYYRCAATRPDYATPSVPGHPPTYSIREERILAAVDDWLATITDPDHLDATVEAILAADRAIDPEPAEVTRARRQRQQLGTELDRMLAAIRAGMDPELAARETRKIQADIATVAAAIERWERSAERVRPLAEVDVRSAINDAGGLVGLLAVADRTERASLYRALGIRLTYEKQTTGHEVVRARLSLCGGGGRI